MTESMPERPAPLRHRAVRGRPPGQGSILRRLWSMLGSVDASVLSHGTWRAAVAEDSMLPALEPGDFLLLDPTTRRWPRRGSIVVIREPDSDVLAIKRVAARGGDHVESEVGLLHLADGEAWLLGDAADRSVDSRTYGPVTTDRIVARAWFRYWPLRRIGRVGPVR